METVLLLALLALLVVGAAWLGNYFQEASSTESLMDPKGENECSLHIWKEAVFLNHSNRAEFDADPEKFLKKKSYYCTKCGSVPSLKKIVKPKFLVYLNHQQERLEESEQKRLDIEELKRMWLEEFLKHHKLAFDNQEWAIKGFNHYDSFVENLPKLVKAKQLARLMKKLAGEVGPDQTKN